MLITTLILFIIFFLLIIPVDLVFAFSNLENQKSTIKIKLFFGLLQFRLFPRKKIEKREKPAEPKPPRRKKRVKVKNVLNLVRNEKFISKFAEFIKKILKSIKLQLSRLYIRLGFDDPADTGILWGLLGPALVLLDLYSENSVIIEPEFQDSALDVDTVGKVSIIPIEILLISLIFLLSPTTVKAIWVNFGRGVE